MYAVIVCDLPGNHCPHVHSFHSFGGVVVGEPTCVSCCCSFRHSVTGITKFLRMDSLDILPDINPKGGEQRCLELSAQINRCMAFQFA